jgi:hypothetical protein
LVQLLDPAIQTAAALSGVWFLATENTIIHRDDDYDTDSITDRYCY